MSNLTQEQNHYLADLLQYRNGGDHVPGKLKELQEHSAKRLKEIPFPTQRDEEYRFTSLKPLTKQNFVPVSEAGTDSIDNVDRFRIPEAEKSTIVLVNGVYSEELSTVSDLPEGVIVGNLADYVDDNEHAQKHLNAYAEYDDDVFVSFNGAFASGGAFIYLPKETKVEAPIHLLHISTDAEKPFFTTPRMLVYGERYAEATIFEDHIGVAGNAYFNVPVGEFRLDEGCHVKHVKIQRESFNAVHFSRPVASLAKHANYESYTINRGAWLNRNDPKVIQTDEEVTFVVDGLVLIDGNQISDTHSTMDHKFSHANSHQLHKCVIEGSAHSIFNGKIYVRKDAQKIDSFQENRNMLLSRKGQVNTKPQLEIFADDVVCTHGATIGQMEEDEVFYLQSRGLSEQKAKELLTYAFALETIENIKVESVNKLLLKMVEDFTREASDKQKETVVAT